MCLGYIVFKSANCKISTLSFEEVFLSKDKTGFFNLLFGCVRFT